jgi:hypothetical protein
MNGQHASKAALGPGAGERPMGEVLGGDVGTPGAGFARPWPTADARAVGVNRGRRGIGEEPARWGRHERGGWRVDRCSAHGPGGSGRSRPIGGPSRKRKLGFLYSFPMNSEMEIKPRKLFKSVRKIQKKIWR